MAGMGEINGLLAGRVFLRFSFTLVHLAMDQHLIDAIAKGDHVKAQRLSSLMSTVNSVISFALRPVAGALLDSYGRKPFLVLCPLFSAIARACVLARPGTREYVAYRILINIALLPLWSAITSYLCDKFGRATPKYTVAMQRMRVILTLVGLLANRVGSRIGSAKTNIALSCLVNLLASASFLLFTSESLKKEERKEFAVSKAANPLSFLSLISRSQRLRSLAPILIMQAVPDYDYTSGTFYRQRFGWKVTETANLMFFNQISGIIESWVCPENPMIRSLGIKATTQLSGILGTIMDLNSAYTTIPETIYCNSVLSIFMHGRTAIDALVSAEAKRLKLGSGELSAALANLTTPLRFVMPAVYSVRITTTLNTSYILPLNTNRT